MKDVDYKLVALTGYVTYLLDDKYKFYNFVHKRDLKRLNKKLIVFCKEYTKKELDWK